MGLQNLGIHDPDEIFTIINDRTIQGYADDEMVRTERTDPNEFLAVAGAQGDYTFQKNLDRTGLIIITLKQLSPDNVFLQSLLEGSSLFAVQIVQQQNHKEIVKGVNCMIGVAPRPVLGKLENNREWTIAVGELIETRKAIT